MRENANALMVENDAGITPYDMLQDIITHVAPEKIDSPYGFGKVNVLATLKKVVADGLEKLGPSRKQTSIERSIEKVEKEEKIALNQQCDDLIDKTLFNIEMAFHGYKKIHLLKSDHGKDFQRVITEIKNIKSSNADKITQLKELVYLFEKEYRNFLNPMSKEFDHANIIASLRNNPKQHHFTRTICLTLQDVFKISLPGVKTGLRELNFNSVEVPNTNDKNIQKIYKGYLTPKLPETLKRDESLKRSSTEGDGGEKPHKKEKQEKGPK